eukprot:TRINITY_DN31705_c0_g1_i1.p1 TRINITY_DN31705_c0_g1~~TRINITY_DN31705_c0_g1_i1.p1  ORF type:complete len:369 (-),score=80.21 TRINITY_DN31705_c0_g1_i1:105-1130(-)
MGSAFKAFVCKKLGKSFSDAIDDLSFESVSRKPLKDREVRIRVIASSLNFFDLLMLVGKYQSKPDLPFIAGSEASGIVTEIGAKVTNVTVGDAVFVMAAGAFAEELVAPAALCLPKPKSLTHAQASALFVGFMTAYHGLAQRGQLKAGETVLVTGAAGGMGSIAVQVAKLLGASVIAGVSSDDKLNVVKELGADFAVNYAKHDLRDKVMEFTSGKGADVIYDPVGGDVFDQCVRCVASEGRLLVIGFASGRIPTLPANLPLVKGFSLVGVRAGFSMQKHPHLAMEMFQQLTSWTSDGKLTPRVSFAYQPQRAKEALRLMAERKVTGKAVIQFAPEPVDSKL